jgi:integrase
VIQAYLQEIAGTLSDVTVEQYSVRLQAFNAFCGGKKFDRQIVVAFLKKLKEEGTGPASIAAYKSAVSAFYTWLVENDHIKSNPVRNLKFGRYVSPKKKDECLFTKEEYEALKVACDGRKLRFDFWKGAIIIGWNSGMRMGDVATLEWSEIDMDQRKLVLMPNKTRRFRKVIVIPMTAELHSYFLKEKQQKIAGYLFPAMKAEYEANGAKQLSQQFTRICERAGIEGKSFHHLRHTFVSRLLSTGAPLNVVSSITGQTLPVLNRYSHAEFESQVAVINGLG